MRWRPLDWRDEPIPPAGTVRIRVGGSFDDLWAFFAQQTREALARALTEMEDHRPSGAEVHGTDETEAE